MKPLTLDELMATHGVEVIGDGQRTIAYTVVADAGAQGINVTAVDHGLKKYQTIYFPDGVYEGIHRVKKVLGDDNFIVDTPFISTEDGNIDLTASLDGFGFIVNPPVIQDGDTGESETPLTIVEFEPENQGLDVAAIIAKKYIAMEPIHIPFRKIRISAGSITVVRRPPKANLSYSNRYS